MQIISFVKHMMQLDITKYYIVCMNTYTKQYLVNTIYGDSRTGIAVLQLNIFDCTVFIL